MAKMDADEKFASRHQLALFMQCKFCGFCGKSPEMKFVLGIEPGANKKFCNLEFQHKYQLLLEHRVQCDNFNDENIIERDTTYPGATYAPFDKHANLLDDSSSEDHIYTNATSCLNYIEPVVKEPKVKLNNWEACLDFFDRKNESGGFHKFPHHSEVLRLLATSRIPTYGFKISLPEKKWMGIDRGLWFYRSEKKNFDLEKNAEIKSTMKKVMMVYLYNVWFKRITPPSVIRVNKKGVAYHELEDEVKERTQKLKDGIFFAMDCADRFSLAKDLAWWMLNVFKDESALRAYPQEEEIEIEFISLTVLDRALEAAELAHSGCETSEELDAESIAYDQMLNSLGYDYMDDELIDREGREVLY